MKTLILDTSSPFLYVGILEDGKEIYKKVLEGKNNHSEHLMPIIEEGFKSCNFDVKDLDKIIVGIGPGSYTGLRISLVIAKMFSWTLGIKLHTVSSLDILGSGHFVKDGIYAICNVAKKNYLYSKVVEVKNGKINNLIDEEFILETEFLDKIKDINYSLVDSNNYKYSGEVIEKLETVEVEDVHPLIPNYLRKDI